MKQSEVLHESPMIEVNDEFGLKLRVPRAEYLQKMLPHNIQLHWDKPDELAATIRDALHNDIYVEIEKAARHLLEIDNIKERAARIYGTLLLQTERYLEAESFYSNYLDNNPRHPYVLTNLARTLDFLAKNAEAVKTLEESLKLDPNQEDALNWWVLMKKDELQRQKLPVETAIIYAFEQAKIRFSGWLVKLLLGIEYLKQRDKDEAYNNFTDALQADNSNYDTVLTTLSSELVSNGFAQDVMELIAPIYMPNENNILTGISLLQAYYELGDVSSGKKLLIDLYKVNNHNYAERLAGYDSKFAELTGGSAEKKHNPEEELASTVTTINYPMWCYGWNIKHGFDVSQTSKNIAILQFACESPKKNFLVTAESDTLQTQLARALPLFLLENLFYNSDLRAAVMLPVCKDKDNAHIFFNAPPENQQVMGLVNQGYSAAVTGIIVQDTLRVSYWDMQRIARHDVDLALDTGNINGVLNLLTDFVATKAGFTIAKDFKNDKRGFAVVADTYMHAYLFLSAQHMTLYMTNNFTKLRDLVHGMLKLAQDSKSIQIQLSMLSIIHLAVRYNYTDIQEHRDIIVKWLKMVANSGNSLSKMAVKTAELFANYCGNN